MAISLDHPERLLGQDSSRHAAPVEEQPKAAHTLRGFGFGGCAYQPGARIRGRIGAAGPPWVHPHVAACRLLQATRRKQSSFLIILLVSQ